MDVDVPVWVRGPARIAGEWIVIDPSDVERYAPIETPPRALMLALAGVQTREQILSFVSRYGLLKHGPDAPVLREAVADFEEEAHLVYSMIYLAKALKGAVAGDLDQCDIVQALAPTITKLFQAPAASEAELYVQASAAIGAIVSQKLQPTSLSIIAGCLLNADIPAGSFVYLEQPPNLLGFVYVQVARQLVERAPIMVCPECSRLFAPRHGRQRFCTPACASRGRFRTFKARQRAQKEEEGDHARTTRKR